MAGLRLESIINETLAGNQRKLSEMSGAVLDTLIENDSHTGKLIQDTLIGSAIELATNGTASSILSDGGQLMQQTSASSIEMGQYERLFWVLIFSVMVLVAAGGNTIVVYIVATNKEMKSVTNYFLVNLSLADTMVSTLNVIFNFISMLNSHWPFGKVYCKISNFIAILSISASVFTLTAISCDRYNAIIHPLRPRMSHRHAIGWILLIWTLSSALALPNFIYSTDLEDRLTNDNVAVTCTMLWPDGRYPLSSYDHIYNIVVLVVTYLVPILTMAILYYKVGKELWGYEAIGENIDKQQRAIMAKKKIVKMMIVVVIIFALCWLPYHAFFVVNYYVPNIFQDSPLLYQRCYLFMYWLAMSNSMYNPIIIYFMNSKFRHEFKKILCLICCCTIYRPVLRPSITTLGNQSHHHHHHQQHQQQQQQQQRASTNHHHNQNQQLATSNNDNLNGQSQTTIVGDQQATNKSKKLTSLTTSHHELVGSNSIQEKDNSKQVAIAINSIAIEASPLMSENGGSIEKDYNDGGENEPFISTMTGNQQQLENIERIKDHLSNGARSSDRLIDFPIKNKQNINTYCPNQASNGGTRITERVWI